MSRRLARIAVRTTTVAATLLLLGAALVPAGNAAPAPEAPTPTTTAPALAPAARAESLGTWKCKPFNTPSVTGKTCARLSVLDEEFKVDYQRSFFNQYKKQTVPFSCSTSKETTWTFGASVTGEAEAGVIFSKVKVSATASVSRSYTTTDTASATVRVKPRRWAHCERGTYVYYFRGDVKRVRCNASGCRNSKESFRGKAPSRDYFSVGPGRG